MRIACYGLLALVALAGITACNPARRPVITSNPHVDDYSAFSPLSTRHEWGPANVHDPAVIKSGDYFYVYSTDAYFRDPANNFYDIDERPGIIPIRRSRDLVNWEFRGWAIDEIPAAAVQHVHSQTGGQGAYNTWAPYVYHHNGAYRLYYSVSSFGANTSFIGLLESPTPEGPWVDRGAVVKSFAADKMNAIDASIVVDHRTGRHWMHYGSYFGGLYVMELNPATGLALTPGDQGHLTATRANRQTEIIEAPEIIYNSDLDQYFLFVSYGPLFSYYNVRVGRSNYPEGPFTDMFGKDLADTTNNYPILTHSYMFEGHPGWSGNAHCAVINHDGRFFMLHQGRLAPNNLMMVMHVREMKWLPSGWPVVSPQRFAGDFDRPVKRREIAGRWEIINLRDELPVKTTLWQGQVPPGGWTYTPEHFNRSSFLTLTNDGETSGGAFSNWKLENGILYLDGNACALFYGWDWEQQRKTILFSGILSDGTGIWGKKREE